MSKQTTEEVTRIIKDAINHMKKITFYYNGYKRVACPHILGKEHTLVFQYDGGSEKGLPDGGDWRNLLLRNISELQSIAIPLNEWKSKADYNEKDPKITHIIRSVDKSKISYK